MNRTLLTAFTALMIPVLSFGNPIESNDEKFQTCQNAIEKLSEIYQTESQANESFKRANGLLAVSIEKRRLDAVLMIHEVLESIRTVSETSNKSLKTQIDELNNNCL